MFTEVNYVLHGIYCSHVICKCQFCREKLSEASEKEGINTVQMGC